MKKILIYFFVIFGITYSFSPLFSIYHKIGNYNSGGRTLSLDVKDEIIYTIKNTGLIEILDVNDPEQPQLIGSCQIPNAILGGGNQIIVVDSLAFVLTFSNGIQIVNISNPIEPQIIGSYNYNNAKDLIISSNYAYIAGYNKLYILDISEILNPLLMSDIYGELCDITLSDNIIYGVHNSSPNNLRIIDVSDPTNPELLSNFNLPIYSPGGIEFKDFITFIAYGGLLWSINVGNPSNPIMLDTLDITNHTKRIIIEENKAIITNSTSGFEVIDITDPSNMSIVSFYDTPGLAEQVKVNGEIAFIADCYSGLQIVDINNPLIPPLINRIQTYNKANGIDINDNYLYICDGYAGLNIVDISDLQNPEICGFYPINGLGDANTVDILNDIAYFCTGYPICSVKFIDVSDPQNPYLLDEYLNTGMWSTVGCVNNSYAFVGSDNANLLIFDETDLISEYFAIGEIYGLTATEQFCFLAEGENGIEIVDISNVNNPTLSGNFDTNGFAHNIAFNNNMIFISDGEEGIQIIDVSEPQNPIQITTLKPNYNSEIIAKALIIENKLIFIDKEWNEMFVYNIEDPFNPVFESSSKWNTSTKEVLYLNDILFSADIYYGVSIIDFSEYLSTEEYVLNPLTYNLINYPNPFNPETTISFSIIEDSIIELSIFNIKGQKVKQLISYIRQLPEGQHSVVWDGKDDNNKPVGSGIYFYQLRIDGNSKAINKMILMK